MYFRRRVKLDFGLVFPPAHLLYKCFFITSGVMMQCAEDGICVRAPYCWRVSMLRNMYNVVAEFLLPAYAISLSQFADSTLVYVIIIITITIIVIVIITTYYHKNYYFCYF